jgi:hypothetical protein
VGRNNGPTRQGSKSERNCTRFWLLRRNSLQTEPDLKATVDKQAEQIQLLSARKDLSSEARHEITALAGTSGTVVSQMGALTVANSDVQRTLELARSIPADRPSRYVWRPNPGGVGLRRVEVKDQ